MLLSLVYVDGCLIRKQVPRKTRNRTDILFYEVSKTRRLRSLEDIKNYCKDNQIPFDSYIFDLVNPKDNQVLFLYLKILLTLLMVMTIIPFFFLIEFNNLHV